MSKSDSGQVQDEKLTLLRKRAAVKGVLTKYFNIFQEQENVDCDHHALLVKEERLRSAFDKFENLNLEICAVDPTANDFDAVESKYLDTLTVIKTLLNNSSPSPQQPQPKQLTKLPQVNVPIFNGKYSEYRSFIGLFDALIHHNSSLESIQKLFYLRNFLQDEPLDLVKNLPLVAESYSEARLILQDRYDNEYKITCDHINILLDITPIAKSTATNIRMFVSTVKQQLAALKNLKHNISSWDPIILCILTRKLDMYCSKEYQFIRDKNAKVSDFIGFLERRASALEDAERNPVKILTPKAAHMVTVKKGDAGAGPKVTTPPPTVCILCKLSHKLFLCPKFKLMAILDRLKFVADNNLCNVCLNNHSKKCRFFFKCEVCKERHNTLLHQDKAQSPVTLFTESNNQHVLLPTAQVKLIGFDGSEIHVRALLDSGSQISFITSELVQLLKLEPKEANTPVLGIGSTINIGKKVNIQLHSIINEFNIPVTCYILNNITTKLPQSKINLKNMVLPKNINLADKTFNKPGVIHMLLGADVFFRVLMPPEPDVVIQEVIHPGPSVTTPTVPVLHTQFGYVIAGSVPVAPNSKQVTSLFCLNCDDSLNDTLSKFWETEKVPEVFSEKSSEHEACEKLFCSSVTLDTKNNKFQVVLPLKLPLESINATLGNSFNLALKRFLNLEVRLQKDHTLYKLYKEFIHDYLKEGHGSIIDISKYDLGSDPVYFLPHHPVLRLDKKTTKCRVVFDGSMKTTTKISLNDLLLNGPVVQKELVDILLLFRVEKYIFITDIKSMFRQVSLDHKFRSLQNILWRDSPKDNIQCIQLNTVTYGLKSSSYLATRCLKELAQIYKKEYPLAAEILENCMYIDDALVSQKSPSLLIESKRQLCELLKIGGFQLHKWFSNCPELLTDIPESLQHFDTIELEKTNASLKTLGIHYHINSDTFMLSCPNSNTCMPTTKREILSFIGKFYDPLGLAGPVVVRAKVIMQRIWQARIAWDAQLLDKLLKAWCDFYESINVMTPIAIPRYISCNADTIQIIGFCDASSSAAYGCCVYYRVIDVTGAVRVSLLGSKSRVNPSKQNLTVPRLELNAAVLLAKLVARICNTLQLKLKIDNVVLYSDSQIVLAWIKTNINTLNAYVSNRVKVIVDLTHKFNWAYINSVENPADCLSRGILPHELVSHPLWWSGPSILHSSEYDSKNLSELPLDGDLPETKSESSCLRVFVFTLPEEQICLDFLNKFSDINKMQRILAYILRFVQYTKYKNVKNNSCLTSKELNDALLMIVKAEQQKYLKDDINDLKNKNKILKGNLKPLCPFIDDRGIVRVGGRLQNALIPYSQKHPAILPRDSRVTQLIIQSEHVKNLHAGQRLVLSTINQKFWIVNGIQAVKKVIHKCVICFKLKADTAKQLMGSLPHDRVNACRPFQKIGLDFAGPILVKQSRIRKSVESKAYVCVFVCFATKAIHLELASDLKTETFLACLKRFIARRGLPTDIYSDNASTFKCADTKMQELYKLQSSAEHQKEFFDFSAQKGINFNFIPCYSPIFAGLAEAGVKSFKFHLKRVVQKALLTYEELNTVLCQIESILNSRPLMPLSNDINDFSCLTPGHFLIGSALNTYPEQDVTLTNNLKFWKICINMKNSFWKVWQKHYLNILQSRPKWRTCHPNVEIGSLVILKEDNTAPMYWPMARVTQIFPGADNKVRVVEVKTANGKTHKRSIVKICVLPIECTTV